MLGDRALASDPGLVRLISASRALLAIATALGLEYLLARLTGAPPLVPLMLGAVMAMLAAFAVLDPTRAGQAVTMCLLPVSLLVGMGLALAVDRNRVLSLSTFVLVVFVAVVVRRFGPRYFACGMVGFMGYFFALFLSLRPEQLPGMLPSVVLAVVWVMVLTLVLVPLRNDRVLRRMVRSFEARLSAAADAAARLAGSAPGTADRRAALDRVRSTLFRVNETALTIDGQLGAPGAITDDARARTVRRALFDGELAAVALVENLGRLLETPDGGPDGRQDRAAATRLVDAVRHGHWDRLHALAEHLTRDAATPVVLRRLAADALVLAAVRAEWTDALTRPSEADGERAGNVFAPAVQLFGGNLPGSVPTASRLHEPDDDRPSPAVRWRLSLTTRQAVQAALATAGAVVVGDALSTQRYYWAVLAAFIAFTGTATVTETVSKALHRTVGTMIGLLAAIPLVPLLGPDVRIVLPVILLSIFGAFYIFRVSYALMIFFITILIGELYSLIGTYTVDLMLLRLAETAAGGAIGCLVAVLVLPTRTRATAGEARRGLLVALAEVLDAVDVTLRGRTGHDELQAAARALDAALHQALLIGRPLGRVWMVAPDPRGSRRLTSYTALAYHARALGRTAAGHDVHTSDGLAALTGACSGLRELVAGAADGEDPAPGRLAAVTDLLVPLAGSADDLAPLAREAGLLAAELGTVLACRTDPVADDAPAGTGRICGPDHEPLAATVTLVDRTGRQDTRTTTDDRGRFTVTPTTAGTYLLVASPRSEARSETRSEARSEAGSLAPHSRYVQVGPGTAFPDVLLAPLAVDAPSPSGGSPALAGALPVQGRGPEHVRAPRLRGPDALHAVDRGPGPAQRRVER